MSEYDRNSRVQKYEKRRKNTKLISFLLVIAVILAIVLLWIWIFGGGDDDASDNNDDTLNITEKNDDDNTKTNENDSSQASNGNQEGNEESHADGENDNENEPDGDKAEEIPSDEVTLNEIENPEDDNVIKAYTGDWEPIGTEQEEPHTTQYDQDSVDWQEMEAAIKTATGLSDMIVHWIGNDGGQQKVVGTVSDPDITTIYRVKLTWQKEEGWQPTQVAILKELDV